MIKILIADEDMIQRETLEAQILRLFPNQFQCRMAENGRRTVDLTALCGADIILMDTELTGISGIEAAKQILAQLPDCQIIFVSASRKFENAYEAIKLGACDYVLKPVNTAELEQAISRATEQIKKLRSSKEQELSVTEPQEETLPGKHSLLMAKVQQYLKHNYMMGNISLDSVSAILNLNASYFSSQFKRSFGVNFVDYLTDLRIQAAKQLLEDPLHSAAEIARMVGYESANYFARAFKKKTGMTPTEYRRSTTGNGPDSGI